MEDEVVSYYKIFCPECGLPMVLNSYEIKNESTQAEKIIIKLKCKNFSHKTINEMKFEDYYESIQKNYHNYYNCKFCNSILMKNIRYCYDCNKIICDNCYSKNENIHKNYGFPRDLDNKCLLHINENKDNIYYCIMCKREMCERCISSDQEHFKNKKIDYIYNLTDFAKNKQSDIITNIKNENQSLLKKIKILQNKIKFNEFLEKEYEKNLNLFRLNRPINILYHDSNYKQNGSYKSSKLKDCKSFESGTKGNVIMTDDFPNLKLLLKYLSKNNSKSKFILIINGSASKEVIDFIRQKNYTSLFISSCIYTSHPKCFEDFKKNNRDLIKDIKVNSKEIIDFINNCSKDYIMENEKYYVNPIICIDEVSKKMSDEFFNLFKEISESYGDETENTFQRNRETLNHFLENGKFPDEIKRDLNESFQTFSALPQKNYEIIIRRYLTDINYSKVLNLLLENKDIEIYKRIKYFVGNLIHSIVKYGKKKNKGVVQKYSTFYRGMELNIIELLEFLKNNYNIITFPSFLSVSKKKEYAEWSSKRKSHLEGKNVNDLYSVIMKFNYSHQEGYEPSIYELKDLSNFPEEEEHIILPFTFIKVKNINTDSTKLICDIELEIIGKKEIFEAKINDKTSIQYDFSQDLMISINEN